jgi:hypothetical protein
MLLCYLALEVRIILTHTTSKQKAMKALWTGVLELSKLQHPVDLLKTLRHDYPTFEMCRDCFAMNFQVKCNERLHAQLSEAPCA